MYEIHIAGKLTSKRVVHVPVFRRWRLVLERREFGTKVDRIDQTFPLNFDAWSAIPEGGVTVKLGSGFSLLVKRVIGTGYSALGVSVIYEGILIPGTYKIFPLPDFDATKILAWHTEVWKGVKIDVEATLSYSP